MPSVTSAPANNSIHPSITELVGTANEDVYKAEVSTTYSDFSDGIVIPSGATIVGCQVNIVCFSLVTLNLLQSQFISVSLDGDEFFGGITPSPAINTSGTLTLSSFGGSTELWSIEESDWAGVNWSNFAVKYTETTNNVLYTDQIQLQIYYSDASNGRIQITEGRIQITEGRISL